MTDHILAGVHHHLGIITLTRPQALNSLSLDMVRTLTSALLAWRDDPAVDAVLIRGDGGKAFCAGGDIRFFYQMGQAGPRGGSALLEDFFTEEYALNHLIHHYPKPYIALVDGIVMGGGMGISQCGSQSGLRIVTERARMAMPEVNIGLFPDVGGSYFLSRCPGRVGSYLGVAGEVINAADALYAGLADIFIPSMQLPALYALLEASADSDPRAAIRHFAAPFQSQASSAVSALAAQRDLIDRHFESGNVNAIVESLADDANAFAQKTLITMQKRSPLMMCVTHEQIRRGADLDIGDCLRMERSMMRHAFEGSEVFEGIRAAVIDKDNAPQWLPQTLREVTAEMIGGFFIPAWPDHAHPLRDWY